jgi:hypothetical protein
MADRRPKLTRAQRQAKKGKRKALKAAAKGQVPTYGEELRGSDKPADLPVVKPKAAQETVPTAPVPAPVSRTEEMLDAPEGIYEKSGTSKYITPEGGRKIQSIPGTGLAKSVSRMGRLRKHSELAGQKLERQGLARGKELTLDEVKGLYKGSEDIFPRDRHGNIPKWIMGYQEYTGEKDRDIGEMGFGMSQHMISDPKTGRWYLPKVFDPRRAYEGKGVTGEKRKNIRRYVSSPIQF